MSAQKLIASSAIASSLIICTAVGAAPPTPNWGGFYVDAAIGARSSTVQGTDTANSTVTGPGFRDVILTSDDMDFGRTNFLGQFSGGWRWANDTVVVGMGLFVDLASDDAGQANSAYSEVFVAGATTSYFSSYGNVSMKQKNRFGLSLDVGPNWRTYPYLKISYAWSDFEVSSAINGCGSGNAGPSSASLSNTYSGFGVGGGVRHLYSENLYFFAEAMWQDYSSKTNSVVPLCSQGNVNSPGFTSSSQEEFKLSPSNLTGVVGVGWKF